VDKKTFFGLLIFGLFMNTSVVACFFIYPVISLDTGFYLAIAKEVYEGKIYFHEIGIPYNPLSILAFGFPFLFDELPSYNWHLIINLLIMVGSSFIFYKILNRIDTHKYKSILFTLFYFFLTIVFDGRHLMLEPLSVFFQLVALLIYLNFKKSNRPLQAFFIGIFITLAFLAKQYGLFILIPIALDFLVFNKVKTKPILLIGLGLILPLAVFYFYLYSFGFTITEFIKTILGKGVELDVGNGTAINASLTSHLIEVFYFLIFNIYILLTPLLLIKFYKKLNAQIVLFLLLFLCSLSVLSFATYFHYFLYVIPYSLILFIYLLNQTNVSRYNKVSYVLFGFSTLLLCCYSFLAFGKQNAIQIEKQRLEQVTLNSVIPEKSKVYLDGPSPALYYLCNFRSINLKKIAYTFPGYFYPETLIKNLEAGSYLVVSEKKAQTYKDLVIDCEFKEIVLGNHNYTVINKISRFRIK
jgi:hypothetical protein